VVPGSPIEALLSTCLSSNSFFSKTCLCSNSCLALCPRVLLLLLHSSSPFSFDHMTWLNHRLDRPITYGETWEVGRRGRPAWATNERHGEEDERGWELAICPMRRCCGYTCSDAYSSEILSRAVSIVVPLCLSPFRCPARGPRRSPSSSASSPSAWEYGAGRQACRCERQVPPVSFRVFIQILEC
jgi:hypothetical protein